MRPVLALLLSAFALSLLAQPLYSGAALLVPANLLGIAAAL